MGRIPEETVELVLASTDIVDLVGSYIPLKRSGSNFKACCPFHNEKTPSFMVNPARQNYKCFGCGAGGSSIGFVMEYENLPFVDAVKKLAARSGIIIQEEAYDPDADKRKKKTSRLLELHNQAARWMHQMLMKSPDAQHARDYLKNRGYGSEMATRWTVGWIPPQPQAFLTWAKEKGFSGRELCDSGLAAQKDTNNPRAGIYLRFRDRLMFPIHNDYGDIIAFSGRQLREDPNTGKYINSPETVLFKKSKVFFALDKARRAMTKEKFALLCEGQIDVIACHENGITTAIAALGTAFTPDHARLLKRYTTEVIICFDADSAGFAAADKAFTILAPEGIDVRMVTMPQGDDPDSMMQREGAESFRELVSNARDYFSVKLDHALANHNQNSPREKAEAARSLTNLIAYVGDKITKEALINQVATRLGLGAEELRGNVVQAEKQAAKLKSYEKNRTPYESESAPEKIIPTEINPTVSYLCHLALSSKEAQDWLGEQLESILEALDSAAGGSVLKNILSKSPDPDSSSSVQAFLSGLLGTDQLALQQALSGDLPSDPIHAAEETCAMLVSSHYQNKEAAIRAKLSEPGISPDHMIALMNEARDLQEMLRNLQQRFIR